MQGGVGLPVAATVEAKTYGHHPLVAFVDHGRGGTGEPVAALLRPGNAGSGTAADHITTARLALAQFAGAHPLCDVGRRVWVMDQPQPDRPAARGPPPGRAGRR